MSSVSPRRSGDAYPPLCTPVLNESRRRPVVRRSGYSSSSASTGGSCSTAANGARASAHRTSPRGACAERARRDDSRRSTATECRRVPRDARSSCRRATAKARGIRPRLLRRVGSPQSCPSRLRELAEDRRFVARLARRIERLTARAARAARCSLRCLRDSHQLAAAGNTTSAISPVFVRKMSCTMRCSRLRSRLARVSGRLRIAPDSRR